MKQRPEFFRTVENDKMDGIATREQRWGPDSRPVNLCLKEARTDLVVSEVKDKDGYKARCELFGPWQNGIRRSWREGLEQQGVGLLWWSS